MRRSDFALMKIAGPEPRMKADAAFACSGVGALVEI
jgi:hypothetical protein